jgi:hypothetical protein
MANPVLGFVKALFEPVKELVSEVIVDKDKANELRASIYAIEAQVATKVIEYEAQLLEAQASTINSEAKGESWLQRNWRPLTMLTFTSLVVAKWLGLTADTGITEAVEIELMNLIQIGLGGYVVGRSAEKIVPQVAAIIKNR